jgi:signal transduction histidine kinase/DNA-binding response OmpR family regulator/HPt (histidine-containing phosphotransfer) domain-containing protein
MYAIKGADLMKERLNILYNALFGNHLPIRQRLLHVITFETILAGLGGVIMTLFVTPDVLFIVPILFMIALGILTLWLSVRTDNVDAAVTVLIVGVCYISFPILFFLLGGKHSGMPMWMLITLVFIAAVTEGIYTYVLSIIQVLIIGGCFFMEYKFPMLVYHIVGGETGETIDLFIATILVGVVFGTAIKYQESSLKNQGNALRENENVMRKAKNDAERANEAKSTFLASMSHEIRTPINTILGMNEMILRESHEDKTLKYADNIDSAGRQLLSLINDILDLSKIERGEIALNEVEYQTATLLNDCVNAIDIKAKEKKLRFEVHNAAQLPAKLYGDEVRIRQIITNILTNAVKFTTVGSIDMYVDYVPLNDDRIMLKVTVKDTGCGIKSEDIPNIFTSFNKKGQLGDKYSQGTGLGLAISKFYADLMNGNISVASEYGIGSTFSIAIPQKVIDNIALGNMENELSAAKKQKKNYHASFTAPDARILSVDDVEINHDVLRMLLKDTLVKLDCVYGGKEAIALCKDKDYDLIIMDHMMPEMDGVEAFKKIRSIEQSKGRNIPVIILTANALTGAEEMYMNEGFAGYLSKPVNSARLEEMLARLLPANLVHFGDGNNKSDVEASKPKEDKNDQDNFRDEIIKENEVLQESINNSEKLSREAFETLPFLDMDYAMDCCADSISLYAQAASGYCNRDNRLELIKKLYMMKAWDDYAINVHALKSSSLLIGAITLSDHAKSLEIAAKEGNLEYVMKHHDEVMEEYERVLDGIGKVLTDLNIHE